MNLVTRLRRALCRHDWLPMYRGDVGWTTSNRSVIGEHLGPDLKCRKCGVMRRVEP